MDNTILTGYARSLLWKMGVWTCVERVIVNTPNHRFAEYYIIGPWLLATFTAAKVWNMGGSSNVKSGLDDSDFDVAVAVLVA